MAEELKTAQPGAESRIRSLLGPRFRFLRLQMEDYSGVPEKERNGPRNRTSWPGWEIGWRAEWPAPGSDIGWPGIARCSKLSVRAETLTKLFHRISDEEDAYIARESERRGQGGAK